MVVFIEPWIGKKIRAALNEKNGNYMVEIDKVHISMIKPGIELEGITICSNQEHGGYRDLNGEIASIKIKGINLTKAIFKNDIDISEITISQSRFKGKVSFSHKTISQLVLPLNIRVGKILSYKIDMAMESTTTAQSYSVKDGVWKVYDLQAKKQDTLSLGIVKQFAFEAKEFVLGSSDSMYSYTALGIIYSATSNTLVINRFSIKPNYTDYDFTSRYRFQTDRIEAGFSNIYFHDFNAADYFISGSLISSYIEIGKMDIKVFHDSRKKIRHVNKPAFQDMIYNYPGVIQIDSIGLINGNVTYTQHAEEANEPGSIKFNEIKAKIYKITNDTIFKTENAFLELKSEALLMGKGKLSIVLRGKIFDSHNTFALSGRLSGMEANKLNPMLEKNAFFYATSGKIDAMNFSLTANNSKATGKMIMLYHGLDIAVKNKRTDDTTALREKFISFMANKKVLDSNPIPGENVREGLIDYERDPERFLFNYCFKSILSGIKSSIIKSQKKRKNS